MHSMQEAAGSPSSGAHASQHHVPLSNGYGGEAGLLDVPGHGGRRSGGGITGSDVAVQAVGMLLPLLAQIGHGGH